MLLSGFTVGGDGNPRCVTPVPKVAGDRLLLAVCPASVAN